jgi:5S rRNA maturation endonuclease (ribonuclease M5)
MFSTAVVVVVVEKGKRDTNLLQKFFVCVELIVNFCFLC